MEKKRSVLIVEDEQCIQHFMAAVLGTNGYEAATASSGAETLEKCRIVQPEVMLLDLGLPDMDGFEVLQKIREKYRFPVVVVSARTGEEDRGRAMELGADAYVTKPFRTDELLECIDKAGKRRKKQETEALFSGKELKFGRLTIDSKHRKTILDGKELLLTEQEYRLLLALAEQAGKVVTYDCLIDRIWGKTGADHGKELRILMSGLRKRLERDPMNPDYIFAEIGVGYRFTDAIE